IRNKGTSRQAKLGKNTSEIMVLVVTWPPFHSIMVVTSPMGDHAPPELAAIIIKLAKNQRSIFLSINLRRMATITIVVVRLSNTADRKKVTSDRIQSRATIFFVRMTR